MVCSSHYDVGSLRGPHYSFTELGPEGFIGESTTLSYRGNSILFWEPLKLIVKLAIRGRELFPDFSSALRSLLQEEGLIGTVIVGCKVMGLSIPRDEVRVIPKLKILTLRNNKEQSGT